VFKSFLEDFAMTNRNRINATLNFEKCAERGSVLETFFPWTKTIDRWKSEGLPSEFVPTHVSFGRDNVAASKYFDSQLADGSLKFESYFGFDPLVRIFLNPPFFDFTPEVLEETETFTVAKGADGWIRKHFKDSDVIEDIKPVIQSMDDWNNLKKMGDSVQERFYNREILEKNYGKYAAGHQNGDFGCRLAIFGFFWTGFLLMGIENHLIAMYDTPELLHEISEYLLKVYLKHLDDALKVLPVDTVYIMEDLSGKNGPMIGHAHFDEFVGNYYRQLVPMLRQRGVKHIIVDTDGDFQSLIPNFIDTGIDGFLPMDVNAGMDIVKVRQEYPDLKFIGAFNKLEIANGKDAIDREFERLMPVIRQGGFIPGSDHQVAPSTALSDYQYYTQQLAIAMKECGADL